MNLLPIVSVLITHQWIGVFNVPTLSKLRFKATMKRTLKEMKSQIELMKTALVIVWANVYRLLAVNFITLNAHYKVCCLHHMYERFLIAGRLSELSGM